MDRAGKTKSTVTVKELPGHSFSGTVTRSTLALDPSTRSLLVEIDLPNGDHALRPGTFAEVGLGLREIPQALVLPPQAIVAGPKGKSVFIIDQGKAKSVAVQTGITDGRWMEITSGLNGDEDVVVVGKRKLLEGATVQASPSSSPRPSLRNRNSNANHRDRRPRPHPGMELNHDRLERRHYAHPDSTSAVCRLRRPPVQPRLLDLFHGRRERFCA
ncbi:MAG: efflux RND transporter periplasmic adaptor subunit [Nitrospiraceae bacterium]